MCCPPSYVYMYARLFTKFWLTLLVVSLFIDGSGSGNKVKLFELLKLMLDMEVLAYGDIMVLTIEPVVAPFDLGS